jgi:hypothetical protein
MKKIFAALFSVFMVFSQADAQKTINDPNAIAVEVQGFHSIEVSNAFDVYISQGTVEALAISASDIKYRDHINVEVKNGVLKISYDRKGGFINVLRNDKMDLKAYISVKNIEKLVASGACNVYVEGVIKTDNLKLILSGATDLKGRLEVSRLTANLSGASHAKVGGTAAQLDVDASGASHFNGYDLSTEICQASASGASKVQITVHKELSAKVSGASDVLYRGDGVIREVKTSGASRISKS